MTSPKRHYHFVNSAQWQNLRYTAALLATPHGAHNQPPLLLLGVLLVYLYAEDGRDSIDVVHDVGEMMFILNTRLLLQEEVELK